MREARSEAAGISLLASCFWLLARREGEMLELLGARGRAGRGPLSVPGLRVWLDAGRITGLADGAAVANWPDASGKGNHAVQANPLKQPVYKAGIANGRPAVRFDGANDSLRYSAANLGGNGRTLFVVGRTNGGGVWQTLAAHGTNAGGGAGVNLMYARTDHATQWGSYVAPAATINSGQVANAFKVLVGVFRTANGLDLVTNGTVFSFASAGKTWYMADCNLLGDDAAGSWLNGDIAEFAAYDRAVSVAERRHVERYLGWKYGIAVG